ncbi:SRSF protein kinase 2-like [Scaptodrosophila lebanonensis]|uniref:non-specific serine/threonine protein kinase n=1 Tax=Drosophila lebanonensis TaxID=7225 RepID=A0A6J2TZL2_DROLE|nr:SRSF protein kinase 2-like [Scaptodrosophila lebanonensis]
MSAEREFVSAEFEEEEDEFVSFTSKSSIETSLASSTELSALIPKTQPTSAPGIEQIYRSPKNQLSKEFGNVSDRMQMSQFKDDQHESMGPCNCGDCRDRSCDNGADAANGNENGDAGDNNSSLECMSICGSHHSTQYYDCPQINSASSARQYHLNDSEQESLVEMEHPAVFVEVETERTDYSNTYEGDGDYEDTPEPNQPTVVEESPGDYRIGGYHPIAVGDIFQNRYHVLKKLGWGHFSTVWMCHDSQTHRYCAVKVVKSAEHFTETARDEIRLLKNIDKSNWHPLRSRLIELMDNFHISGENGTHQCIVFEVLGDNLLTLIQRSRYRGLPLYNVKQIARQVLEGLAFLHNQCHIIHTDLKPENVLLVADDVSVRSQANIASKTYLESYAGAKGKESAKQSSRLGITVAVCPYSRLLNNSSDSKLTKTAKRRLRARIKRSISFFKAHRQWLRRRGVEDLLMLASHGLLTPSLAAAGVTNQLPFLPFDDLVILDSNDLAQLQRLNVFEQVGDMPAPIQPHPHLQQRSVSAAARIGEEPPLRHSMLLSVDGNLRGKRAPKRGGAVPFGYLNNVPLGNIYKQLEGSSEMLKLLVNNPEKFVRRVQQRVEDEDRKAQPHHHPQRAHMQPSKKHKKQNTNKKKMPKSPYEKRELKAGGSIFTQHRKQAQSEINLDLLSRKDPALEPCKFHVKIADMGNACWFHHHFTNDIQTREYRAVEVILGAGYDQAADVWSAGCLFWELATGDYLFDPLLRRGNAPQDEVHIANIIETCGSIPESLINCGEYAPDFFNSDHELRNIKELAPRSLAATLIEHYRWAPQDAYEFVEFLMPLLNTNPHRRLTASNALLDEWLILDENRTCGGSEPH